MAGGPDVELVAPHKHMLLTNTKQGNTGPGKHLQGQGVRGGRVRWEGGEGEVLQEEPSSCNTDAATPQLLQPHLGHFSTSCCFVCCLSFTAPHIPSSFGEQPE